MCDSNDVLEDGCGQGEIHPILSLILQENPEWFGENICLKETKAETIKLKMTEVSPELQHLNERNSRELGQTELECWSQLFKVWSSC